MIYAVVSVEMMTIVQSPPTTSISLLVMRIYSIAFMQYKSATPDPSPINIGSSPGQAQQKSNSIAAAGYKIIQLKHLQIPKCRFCTIYRLPGKLILFQNHSPVEKEKIIMQFEMPPSSA